MGTSPKRLMPPRGTAPELLLRMVDELSLCIAPMARSVNGATGPVATCVAPRMAEAAVIKAVLSWVGKPRPCPEPRPRQLFDAVQWLPGATRASAAMRQRGLAET
jgi:hypothetical protein